MQSLVPRDGLEPSHLLGGRFWVSCVYQFHHRGMHVLSTFKAPTAGKTAIMPQVP